MADALLAIQFARINGVPFLGTCGGFQHALIEYARNVLGLADADHTETNPQAVLPLISQLSCSLVEKDGKILLQEGSQIRRIYGTSEILESYHSNYGLNPACQDLFKSQESFRFTGRDRAGEPRVLELSDHPFFIATLFQPERSALRGHVHPLVSAYLEAIMRLRGST
jgi:CTP synthase (UTP-ammonia lyase)